MVFKMNLLAKSQNFEIISIYFEKLVAKCIQMLFKCFAKVLVQEKPISNENEFQAKFLDHNILFF